MTLTFDRLVSKLTYTWHGSPGHCSPAYCYLNVIKLAKSNLGLTINNTKIRLTGRVTARSQRTKCAEGMCRGVNVGISEASHLLTDELREMSQPEAQWSLTLVAVSKRNTRPPKQVMWYGLASIDHMPTVNHVLFQLSTHFEQPLSVSSHQSASHFAMLVCWQQLEPRHPDDTGAEHWKLY